MLCDRTYLYITVVLSITNILFLHRTECGLLPADFVFLLDSSGSETSANFNKQVDFMRNFTSRFTIGPNNTQFASITFSTGVRGDFDLNDNQNQQELQSAINKIHYINGETATHLALNYAKSHSIAVQNGGRPGVQKYVVVMTDGRSNEPQMTVANANSLKHQPNVTVIALGIGSAVDKAELLAIASDAKHAFTVSNFDLLHVLEKELTDTTCTVCGDQPADLVFLLDSSGSEGSANFQLQKQFVSSVINEFDISPTDTQVGLATFSTSSRAEILLQQYTQKPSLIQAVQHVAYKDGETRTDLGLHTVERNIFRPTHHHYGPRNGAKRFVIVLTDGRSNEPTNTESAAHSLKRHVDEVFAIGIGHSVDTAELKVIATDDHQHVFQAGNFHDLQNLKGRIVKKICEHRIPPPTTTPLPTTTPTTVTTTPTTTTTVKPECGDKPADIVFVLDSSESEKNEENFTKQINFVYNFAKQFEIGPKNVTVQYCDVFSSAIRNDFLPKYLQSPTRSSPRHPKPPIHGAGTNTSSNSYCHTRLLVLKKTVDKVIAIGIGDKLDTNELSTIASDHHPLTVTNFDLLHTIQQSLEKKKKNAACNRIPPPTTTTWIPLVVKTSANFNKQVDFLRNFTSRFTIGPNNTQFASITFSNRSHSNYAKSHSIAVQNGGRPGVQKYVVVMTDGRSNEPQMTVANANSLKHQPNVTVIALGIGSAVDKAELLAIASDAENMYSPSVTLNCSTCAGEGTDGYHLYSMSGDQPAGDLVFLLDSYWK
ncbi:LOW QUALITY PROTEIN: collagen alpha-5(VI) chain-like [Argopecten irradians]|uniref:LOW QUALITY PROTEIN: collagen alpha-5(VI) chain-like n=1 Tax=Argopecten irradians TaxID=31199 RepID=UPI00371A981B